jgi:hypothetical protein
MAKSTVLKKQQTPEFDFSDMMLDSSDDEAVLGMMSGLIEAYRHQQQTAIELTKLVVERNIAEPMKEGEIFATFKRASQVVSEISPMKELWEKMNG